MDKVYFLSDGSNIKIGFTSQKLEKRIQQLNTGSANQIVLLGWISGDKTKEEELHKRFSCSRIRFNGEWFRPTQDILDYINTNNRDKNAYIEVIEGIVYKLFKLPKI